MESRALVRGPNGGGGGKWKKIKRQSEKVCSRTLRKGENGERRMRGEKISYANLLALGEKSVKAKTYGVRFSGERDG